MLNKIFKQINTKINSLIFNISMLNIFFALIPLIVVSIYFYGNFYYTIKSDYENYFNIYVDTINERIEKNFKTINNTSMVFLSNIQLRNLLQDDSDKFWVKSSTEIDTTLKNILLFDYSWKNRLIDSVFVINNKGSYKYLSRYAMSQQTVNDVADLIIKSRDPLNPYKIVTSPDQTLFFVREVNDINTNVHNGQIALMLNNDELFHVEGTEQSFNIKSRLTIFGVRNYSESHKNENIIVHDLSGRIIFNTNNTLVGQKIDDGLYNLNASNNIVEINDKGTIYLVFKQTLERYGISFLITVPKYEVFRSLQEVTNIYLLIIFLIISVSSVWSISRSRKLTVPFKNILNNINKIKNGNYKVKFEKSSFTEFNQLSSTLEQMEDEINNLINEVYKNQLLLKDSELKLLRSQINPHFIFNTLEAISWHARMANNEVIYKAINALGEILRASISSIEKEKVTIENELEYIDFYLNLQKLRMEDRLEILITIADEKLLLNYIPKFCIQSLVENAIIHGFECKRGLCILKIQIWEEDEEIYICVEDNGAGFNVLDQNKEKDGHTGIGFNNADKRIKALYGNVYGIKINSIENRGTKAIVNIPIDNGVDNNV